MCMMHMLMPGMNHTGHDAQQPAALQTESLLDVLKRRYALGEIDQTQFIQMKHVLGLPDGVAQPPFSGGHTAH